MSPRILRTLLSVVALSALHLSPGSLAAQPVAALPDSLSGHVSSKASAILDTIDGIDRWIDRQRLVAELAPELVAAEDEVGQQARRLLRMGEAARALGIPERESLLAEIEQRLAVLTPPEAAGPSRLGSGVIRGRVLDAETSFPLVGAVVSVRSSAGFNASDTTDATGRWETAGLPAGTFFAIARADDHRDELWEDLPCVPTCDPLLGTPIPLAEDGEVSDVNFDLDLLGGLSGQVTAADTAAPVPFAPVRIWNDAGVFQGTVFADHDGRYIAGGLLPGDYYVSTNLFTAFRNEVFDDVACGARSCPILSGTAVPVPVDSITPGVDFALDRRGSIAGTVTDTATAAPVPTAAVTVFDEDGVFLSAQAVLPDGTYEIPDLTPGSFFAIASSNVYLNELWDDLPCEPSCDVTTGTPIFVDIDLTTPGVDFALALGGAIAGRLTRSGTGAALSESIEIYDSTGALVETQISDTDGAWQVADLPAGDYFVRSNEPVFFRNELFDDIPCQPTCDVTTGTPITVALGAGTSGIDLEIDLLGQVRGRVTDAASGHPVFNVSVKAYDASGAVVEDDSTDSDGNYWLFGLDPENHFLAVPPSFFHGGQIHDGLPCAPGCDPTVGLAVPTPLNTTVAGLDFALPLEQGLSGRVTAEATGVPLVGVAIDLWDTSTGNLIRSTTTGLDGRYSIAFSTASVHVSTANGFGLQDEIYPNVPCPAGPASIGACDPMTGSAVFVPNGPPAVMGIDFALERFELVFADGFEGGDTTAWTTTVP